MSARPSPTMASDVSAALVENLAAFKDTGLMMQAADVALVLDSLQALHAAIVELEIESGRLSAPIKPKPRGIPLPELGENVTMLPIAPRSTALVRPHEEDEPC